MINEGLKKTNGITIVTLVITIVVLLILATITINLSSEKNGTMQKSKQASEDYAISEEKTKIKSAYMKYESDKLTNDEANLTIDDVGAKVNNGDRENGWNITFNGNKYTLSKDGEVVGPIE